MKAVGGLRIGSFLYLVGFAALLILVAFIAANFPWIALAAGLLALILIYISLGSSKYIPGIASSLILLIVVVTPTYAAPAAFSIGGMVLSLMIALLGVARLNISSGMSQSSKSIHFFAAYALVLVIHQTFAWNFSLMLNRILPLGVALALCALVQKSSHQNRMMFLNTFVCIMVVEVGLGTLEMFYGLPPVWGYMGSSQPVTERPNELLTALPGRVVGTFGHPILLGYFCAIAVAIILFSKNRMRTPTKAVLIFLATVGIFYSGSRSALLGLIFAVAVTLVVARGRREKRYRTIMYSAGSLVVIMSIDWLLSWIGAMQESLSFQHRFAVLSSWTSLVDRPFFSNVFGDGPGAISRLFSSGAIASDGFSVTDNQILSTFIVHGAVGLILLLLALYRAFRWGDHLSKAFVAFSAFMFFSLDSTAWTSSLVLLFCASIQWQGVHSRIRLKPQHVILSSKSQEACIRAQSTK